MPFKRSVCDGKYTVVEETPEEPETEDKQDEKTGFNPIFLFPIVVAFLVFAYNRLSVSSQNEVLFLKKHLLSDFFCSLLRNNELNI